MQVESSSSMPRLAEAWEVTRASKHGSRLCGISG